MNIKTKLLGVILLASLGAKAQVAFPEIIINLSYPQYQSLKLDGTYKYIEGGMRGIILYRNNENTYVAFERACPHHPTDDSATVDVDMSGLFMIDHACKSNFSFPDGYPTAGPARRGLWTYRVTLEGTKLIISDEITN